MDKNSDTKNVKFVFYKNELGRLISRNVIRMMYKALIVKKYNKLSKTENNMCSRTLNFGSQVLEMMFTERENYFMNYINRNVFPSYLFKVISIQLNDEIYIQINKEAEKFVYNTIVFNDKKNFIMQLEEIIISNYKIKFLREKLFFIRSKYYVIHKKK